MSNVLPVWFKADHVFSHAGRWYLGNAGSFHVGPYADRAIAKAKSDQITNELRSLPDDSSKVVYVRCWLVSEWSEIRDGFPKQSADILKPLVPVRAGESNKTWSRSDRVFSIGMAWFIATREGIDIGPFNSKKEAQQHTNRVVSLLSEAESHWEACMIAYEYKYRPVEHL